MTHMDRDLEGLGIAVTGAAGDIGNAMAVELARRGARVALLDRVAYPSGSGCCAFVVLLGMRQKGPGSCVRR